MLAEVACAVVRKRAHHRQAFRRCGDRQHAAVVLKEDDRLARHPEGQRAVRAVDRIEVEVRPARVRRIVVHPKPHPHQQHAMQRPLDVGIRRPVPLQRELQAHHVAACHVHAIVDRGGGCRSLAVHVALRRHPRRLARVEMAVAIVVKARRVLDWLERAVCLRGPVAVAHVLHSSAVRDHEPAEAELFPHHAVQQVVATARRDTLEHAVCTQS